MTVAEEMDGSLSSRKVSLLIGEILQLSNRVLPLSYAAQIQGLPRLFSLASQFDETVSRAAASTTLSAVDSLNRNRSRLQSSASSGDGGRDRWVPQRFSA